MLTDVHAALRELIHQEGQISRLDVDVRFEAPTRQFIDTLSRPTVSIYLYELRENVELRHNSYSMTRKDGRAEFRLPPRRIDLRYMVSAIAADIDDEHRLLWRVLLTLLKHQELPASALPAAIRQVEPPLVAKAAQPDDAAHLHDLWSALGSEPRPAFSYTLIAPMDLDLAADAPLVLTSTVRYSRLHNGVVAADIAPEPATRIGGVVRDAAGKPLEGVTVTLEASAAAGSVTTAEGQFTLGGVPDGSVKLRLTRPDGTAQTATLHVPGDAYDITFA